MFRVTKEQDVVVLPNRQEYIVDRGIYIPSFYDESKFGKIRRGTILSNVLFSGVGSEQSGYRPVVVVSNNVCNRYSPTIHVVPLTSVIKKKGQRTHYVLEKRHNKCLMNDSLVMAEQVQVIDQARLSEAYYLGTVTPNDLKEISKCIKEQLDLN